MITYSILVAVSLALCTAVQSSNDIVKRNVEDAVIGSCDSSIYFNTEQNLPDEFDSFMDAYFANLRNGFSINEYGTCGFVAIGMLLSYYDTILNDEIIPSAYETLSFSSYDSSPFGRESPGLAHYSFDGFSKNQLFDWANGYYFVDLQTYLLQISRSFLPFDYLTWSNLGLNSYQTAWILSKYFSNHNSLTGNVANVNLYESTSKRVRNHVISKIQQGEPTIVLVMPQGSISYGHFMVAYAYDELSDRIFGHTGWHDEMDDLNTKTRVSIDDFYSDNLTSYLGAISLSFNIESNLGQKYCLEQDGQQMYFAYNEPQYDIWHQHDYLTSFNCGGIHSFVCSVCSSIKEGEHELMYEHYSGTKHRAFCDCGYSILENHSWRMIRQNGISPLVANPVMYICEKCGTSRIS